MLFEEDKSYCLHSFINECNITYCPRNSCHITDKSKPHSYSNFINTGECLKHAEFFMNTNRIVTEEQ